MQDAEVSRRNDLALPHVAVEPQACDAVAPQGVRGDEEGKYLGRGDRQVLRLELDLPLFGEVVLGRAPAEGERALRHGLDRDLDDLDVGGVELQRAVEQRQVGIGPVDGSAARQGPLVQQLLGMPGVERQRLGGLVGDEAENRRHTIAASAGG